MAVIEGQGNTLRNKKKKKKERARRRREEEAAAAQAKQADTQQSAKEPENPPEEVMYVSLEAWACSSGNYLHSAILSSKFSRTLQKSKPLVHYASRVSRGVVS